jgi:hypothetical protein
MIKNKKTKAIILILVLLVIIGALFLTLHKKQIVQTIAPTPETQSPNTVSNIAPATKTVLEINGVNYEDNISGKISVYDFMSKLRNEGKINFTEKNYIGMGDFIVSINGVKNDSNMGWIYYVNGKEASVGVSNYKINPGDVVSWKYEKSSY